MGGIIENIQADQINGHQEIKDKAIRIKYGVKPFFIDHRNFVVCGIDVFRIIIC